MNAKPFQKFGSFIAEAVFAVWLAAIALAEENDRHIGWISSTDEISWWRLGLLVLAVFLVYDGFMDWMKEIDKARYGRRRED